MNTGNLIFQLIFLGSVLLLMLPYLLTKEESEPDCIEKRTRWCDKHQRQEHIWTIEGDEYRVQETPNGEMEIIGLESRFE